jgi:ABC-type dipeptide/oligopeptide/nickel transport system permease component
MGKYLMCRMVQLVLVLAGVTFLTFMLTYLAPGDPAELMLTSTGVTPTPRLVQQIRTDLGLNKPVLIRYFEWLTSALKGDFGVSYKYRKPVLNLIWSKLPATLLLTGSSLFLMILIALPLGVVSALHQNGPADYLIRLLSFAGISMPSFWIGLVLLYLFSIRLKLLPVIGNPVGTGIILPAVTMAVAITSKYIRQLRTAILEEIAQDYVIGAQSRGIKERTILFKHILQNALLPIITLLGMSVGSLLGGAAIIETIFMWPGVGQMAVEAVFNRDYPLIQGYVVWMTVIYVLVNLLVDTSYHLFDPRIRWKGER